MNLNDYFLVKCFKKSDFREGFNSGSNIYINSMGYYWKLENTFQQDHEGLVFQQEGEGYLIRATPEFEDVIKAANSLEDIKRGIGKLGEILCETTDFFVSINGYICCFYLLSKKDTHLQNNIMSLTNEKARNDFALFFNKYLEESEEDKPDFFASIYDATAFCNIFCSGMSNKGYAVTCRDVEYKDLDTLQRIRLFQKNEIASLVFTKPVKYSYQKEFRIYLSKKGENTKDHISERGIDISRSIVGSFDYKKLIKAK